MSEQEITASLSVRQATLTTSKTAVVVAILQGDRDVNSIKHQDIIYLQSSAQILPLFEIIAKKIQNDKFRTYPPSRLQDISGKQPDELQFFEELAQGLLPSVSTDVPAPVIGQLIALGLQKGEPDIMEFVKNYLNSFQV